MANNFYPYPTEFPSQEVAYLLPLLRGKKPDDLNDAVQAGWVLVGYGKKQLSGAAAGGAFKPLAVMSAKRREAALEALEASLKVKTAAVDAKAIPWEMVLAIAWPLIESWIKKKLGK